MREDVVVELQCVVLTKDSTGSGAGAGIVSNSAWVLAGGAVIVRHSIFNLRWPLEVRRISEAGWTLFCCKTES
ncbi:hypothetical protein BDF14DRAFT_1780380 [Spinellus fusiger]|nr:hypothetical protein BDF14DRAFT_1780365 [Spinellus fusiger]KAI7869744.1 hypothetical protein BDF14DRAFT_1780380 [Spinellus fusiger]